MPATSAGENVDGNSGQIAELPGCETHELSRGGVALTPKAEGVGGDACWRSGIDKGHLISKREHDVPLILEKMECYCHGSFFE